MSTNTLTKKRIRQIAGHLSNRPIDTIVQGGSGGNSRIYKVCSGDEKFALKFYRAESKGKLPRQETEYLALKFFETHGYHRVPRFISMDRGNNCSLLEWIDGEPIEAGGFYELDAAARFLRKVHVLRRGKETEILPLGTEACLSGTELVRQLHARVARLKTSEHKWFKDFLCNEFSPEIEKIENWARSIYEGSKSDFSGELHREHWTLSPVDFGFHNMLRKHDGNIIFLDFEYFGWADPVNLAADTLLHPGINLKYTLKQHLYQHFMQIYGAEPSFYNRLKALYPLYGLRWCTIIMNHFLPGYVASYTDGMTQEEKTALLEEKFLQVRASAQFVFESYAEFPYVN
jgi:hypothetical protein